MVYYFKKFLAIGHEFLDLARDIEHDEMQEKGGIATWSPFSHRMAPQS